MAMKPAEAPSIAVFSLLRIALLCFVQLRCRHSGTRRFGYDIAEPYLISDGLGPIITETEESGSEKATTTQRNVS